MISIARFTVEGLKENCVTDNQHPLFAFYYESEDGCAISHATILFSNGYKKELKDEVSFIYDGPLFDAYTRYEATLTAFDQNGNSDSKTITFETGKLNSPWVGKWITDGLYEFKEKGISPRIMTFRKKIMMEKEIKEAKIYATAMGVYRIDLNGSKVGKAFLKPGFTSYANNLMYQVYDVKDQLKDGQNDLIVNVAGGWAVGSFVFTRVNRIYASRQALLMELRIKYKDGKKNPILRIVKGKMARDMGDGDKGKRISGRQLTRPHKLDTLSSDSLYFLRNGFRFLERCSSIGLDRAFDQIMTGQRDVSKNTMLLLNSKDFISETLSHISNLLYYKDL